MSSFLFPTLPGISGVDVTRNYVWKTAVQEAISGKTTAVSLRAYPLVHYELVANLLRNDQTPSELLQVQGLYNAVKGRGDTFLYSDPEFNTVSLMPFALTAGGAGAIYPTTATWQNASGPGGAELIQNFNGTPTYYLSRFGSGSVYFPELLKSIPRTNLILQSAALDNASWTKTNFTVNANTTVAPDSTTSMDSIVESTAASVQHFLTQTVSGLPAALIQYTWSIFVKPAARSWVMINMTENIGATAVNAWFNISTGAIGTLQLGANWAGASVAITAVPDDTGVYRISVTANTTNLATSITCGFFSTIADAATVYAGTTSTVATIGWGAQLEANGAPTMYLQTTTATVTVTDYSIDAVGNITIGADIPNNSTLLWSGSFYYRCRFDEDEVVWSKFMTVGLWTVKKLMFTSVKL